MKILVVRTDHIGDVLLSFPALKVLRDNYPQAHITLLVGSWGKDIASLASEHYDELMVFDIPWGRRKSRESWIDTWKFAKSLRGNSHDLSLNFRPDLKTAVFNYLIHAKKRVGLDLPRTRWAHTLTVPMDTSIHALEMNLKLLEGLGCKYSRVEWGLRPCNGDASGVQSLLARCGVEADEPYIVLAPFAGYPAKELSVDKWCEIARSLSADTGMRLVVSGTTGNRADAEVIASAAGGLGVNLAGEISVKELVCLMSDARATVCVDSSPMHISAAVGTPTVALFGPTDPNMWGPYRVPHRIISVQCDCVRPCRRMRCADSKCLDPISAADVTAATKDLLASGNDNG